MHVANPMVLITFAFILGIILGQYLNGPPWAFGIPALIAGVITLVKIKQRSKFSTEVLLLFAVSLGAFWLSLAQGPGSQLAQQTGTYLDLTGWVAEEGRVYENRETYLLQVHELLLPEGNQVALNEPVLLTIYLDRLAESQPVTVGASPSFGYGDVLRVHGQLELPKGPRNPGEFDYRAYLLRRGVHTQITVYPGDVVRLESGQGNPMLRWVLSLKARVKQEMVQVIPPEQTKILQALLFGDQTGLSPEDREQYQRTGLIHIFSVSGFHVGFVLLFALFLGQIARLSPKGQFWLALAVMFFFAALAGFQTPVMRATIMAVIGLAGHLWRREQDLINSLAVAALVLLLWNPQWLFEAGFQLSFLATWGIVYLYPRLDAQMTRWAAWRGVVLVPLCAQLAVIPLVAYYFNQVSVISLVSNVLLAGLVGVAILMAFFAFLLVFIFPLASQILFLADGALIGLVTKLVTFLSLVPGAAFFIGTPSIWLMLGYYFLLVAWGEGWLKPAWYRVRNYAVFYFSRFSRSNLVPLVCLILVVGLAAGWYFKPAAPLRVVFLDVGQGDSILIETPAGKRILVDGGGNPTFTSVQSAFDVGRQVVVSYLRREGINKLDVVVNTHPDSDHLQGLSAVLEAIPVSLVLSAPVEETSALWQEFYQQAQALGVPVVGAKRGMSLNLDPAVLIEVLHPGTLLAGTRSDVNNNSVVLRIKHGQNALLLTGDLEAEGMQDLRQAGVELRSQVYKVPHHGSRYSLDPQFFAAVDPQVTVISVGKNNFGHPDPAVLEACQEGARPLFRTDQHGAITVESDGQRLKVMPFIRTQD
jgi:competence protein ComEC